MKGQGAIIGAGAMEYPAEFQGASDEKLAEMGVGKLMTLTSTYDHRIIQGCRVGAISCARSHNLLISDEFYDEIFHALGNPYEPVRWRKDVPEGAVDKNTRVLELIAWHTVTAATSWPTRTRCSSSRTSSTATPTSTSSATA